MRLLGVLGLIGGLSMAVHAQAEEPVPAAVAAARHAKFIDAKISPKGTYLALIGMQGGKRTLMFIDLKTRKFASVLKPDADDMVGEFDWANDQRVVAQIVSQDGSLAAPVSFGELYAIDATGHGGRMVFGYRAGEMQTGSHIRRGERDYGAAWVVDPLLHDDRRVLIATKSWRDNPDEGGVDLYTLDVYTGVKDLVTQVPTAWGWAHIMTDEAGQPRIAAGPDADMKQHVFYRDQGQDWRELTGLKWMTRQSEPFGFVAQDRTMYLADAAPDGFGLFAVNIETGARKLLASNPKAPPRYTVRESATGRIVAVGFEPDLPAYTFVEPEHPLSRLIRSLQAAYPDERVRILSRTADDRLAVATISSDRDPGRFLLVDVEKLRCEPIVEARPWVKPEQMAPMSAFHMPASDGVRIHGFFTLPPDVAQGTAAPLVVIPHGGPHGARDTWSFDPEVQLLASHGFAVLQVNYRGSGGYGRSYMEAGYRHWGDRVVQDIVDATRWMVAKGLADPKRACIYGGSFGGYAALQATILAPDLFRCAVGYAGVYDLSLMEKVGDIPETRLGRGYVRTAVGDNPSALRSASPVYNAEKIKARVLLIHGEEDRRVPIEHAEALRDALTAKGNPPDWLVEAHEGHGFYAEGARERMYKRLVDFLKANTRASVAASPSTTVPAATAH